MDAKLAIKRFNTRKAKLDEILSFGRHPHDKTKFGYDEFNKAVVDKQTLIVAEKMDN
jgi:hypothetical protein